MIKPTVLVIDVGLGNIGSVVAALARHDCQIDCARTPPSPITSNTYTHVVLPGVGAFASGMEALARVSWDSWITDCWLTYKRPLLGICLGMQLLSSEGSEGSALGNMTEGLNLIPGHVTLIPSGNGIILPHVGWNDIHWKDQQNPLAHNIPSGGDMYFVHSYFFQPTNSAHCLATSHYGLDFASVVGRGNCYGVQFHPEKSQRLGKRLISNFLAL